MQDIIILTGSLALQCVAAALALRLARTSAARLGWLAIFVAIGLMAARRSITLYRTFEGSTTPDVVAESVALLISFMMLVGVVTIGPLFNAVAKSEHALHHEKSRAQSYLDVAGVMIVALSREGRITLANKKACETLSDDGESLVGQDWFETCLPHRIGSDIRERFEAIIREDTPPADYFENEVLTRTGEIRLIAWHNVLLHDSSGKIAGTLSSGIDITQRRNQELELERLHSEVAVIWESLPICTYMCDAHKDFAVTYVSPNVVEQCGFHPKDFTSSATFWAERIHPSDRERVLAGIPNRGSHQVEYRWKIADGTWQWVSDFMRFVEEENGNVTHVVGMWQNITDRKQAEITIKESEERFRQVAENISEVFWLTDWKHKELLYVSPNYERIFGRSVESLRMSRRSWLDAVCPEDRNRVGVKFKTAAETGVFVEDEYRIIHPDGSERWIRDRAYPVRNEDGEVYRIVGVAEDVTDRRQAVRELSDASARMDAIFSNIEDCIVLIDSEGTIENLNRSAEKLFGYRANEVIGKNVKRLMPEPYHSEHDEYIAAYWRTGIRKAIGMRREVTGRRKDGSTFPLELHLSEVDLGDRRIFCGVVTNLTFRQEAAELIAKHNAELAHVARLSTMGEMAAGLAHEVSQPLTAIVNYTAGSYRHLRDGASVTPELLDALNRASSQARRAGEIIHRLFDFAQKREPRRDAVNLSRMIGDVIKLLSAELRNSEVHIDRDVGVDLPTVRGDSVQLQQVMINLIMNGFEAMIETPVENKLIRVQAKTVRNDMIRVSVTDRGHGLNGDSQQNIFNQFHTTKKDGLGMGLSISRSIIEQHGGLLTARNNESGGATFSFTLPCNEGKEDS